MVENAGRKLFTIAIVLVAALLLLIVPDKPVRMGLDLAGGTRLLYRLDIESAREKNQIDASETDDEILNQSIAIIRTRVDPHGVTEPIIRRAGGTRIEIALPGSIDIAGSAVTTPLARDLSADATATIFLTAEGSDVGRFPANGGTVRLGDEEIRYGERQGAELRTITRGFSGTTPTAHSAGETLILISDDSIKNAIENLGRLRFYPVATEQDTTVLGITLGDERAKVDAWLADPANAEIAIGVYNSLSPDRGGAPEGLLWFPRITREGAEDLTRAQRGIVPVLETPEEWSFSGSDLARVFRTQDQVGYPAVGFEMNVTAKAAFGDFTGNYVGKQVAIVLNDEVVTDPVIQSPLIGQSQISGGINGFTNTEVDEMVTVLRSGSLKIKPILESEERVGATLGADYVKRGFQGGLFALSLTLIFMAFYYRRLGQFACIALAANLILLLGAMVLVDATLTLPGIAGIILTVGMAVDANILIFDRIREEAEKGRKTIQAAKDGFANATSAIVDANVTTFLTAAILYNVGTGPIRGFAVTLMIGIITSMFSALVITRLLVSLQIERGIDTWRMTRWLADAKYEFLTKSKLAAIGSTIAIIAGVGLFAVLPNEAKLGIDFLGGARVKVRTEAPHSVEELRNLVGAIPGNIGESAEVAALPVSEAADGGFREFAITFKTNPDEAGDSGEQAVFERQIRTGLAGILQHGPIDASVQGAQAKLALYFEQSHSVPDVRGVLEAAGLSNITVNHRGEQRNVFDVTTDAPAYDASSLSMSIQNEFAKAPDSTGLPYAFAGPIAESTVIGSQVVGELRDSAVQALLLSIFLVVMYLRFRFMEYSYGMAAVAAVVHDILITIGAIALLVKVPFIQVEMNLTMIAAFLTILGYSLNDTIVIFDRVRENLPRQKGTFAEIVNLSINQTLSRTIVTSGTTLITVLVVLAFNFGTGNVLEGFMFALAVGIIAGTYSTIFIACPTLIWLEERAKRKGSGGTDGQAGERADSKKPALTT